MRVRAVLLPIVLGLGVILGWLGRGALEGERGRPARADDAAPAILDGRLERIERELALLRAELETARQPLVVPAGPPAPAGDRRPLGEQPTGDARVLAALAGLEERLDALAARATTESSAADQAALLERLKDPTRTIDWGAWDAVLSVWDRDRDEARRMLKLSSAEQVLERFGPPTDVWSNTSGITWQYGRHWDPALERYALEILLRIPAGYVTQLIVRENR